MGDLYVARMSGVVMHRGRRLPLRKGQTIARAGHPLVDEHPKLWEPLTVHYDVPAAGGERSDDPERPVEQATAAPGEKRNAPKAAKKATKAPAGGGAE